MPSQRDRSTQKANEITESLVACVAEGAKKAAKPLGAADAKLRRLNPQRSHAN